MPSVTQAERGRAGAELGPSPSMARGGGGYLSRDLVEAAVEAGALGSGKAPSGAGSALGLLTHVVQTGGASSGPLLGMNILLEGVPIALGSSKILRV